jgi:hypothetical protein
MFSPMVFSLASFAAAQAQACKPDLLLDDFKKIDYHDYEGANRYFNLVGGDYGAYRADFTYDDKAQKAIIVPTANENFWFSKFDLGACFDLTGYTGIQFDITAPAGSSLTFTLTQKAPDCVDRLIDSEYTPLSKYITPNGQKQTVLQPLSDETFKRLDCGRIPTSWSSIRIFQLYINGKLYSYSYSNYNPKRLYRYSDTNKKCYQQR